MHLLNHALFRRLLLQVGQDLVLKANNYEVTGSSYVFEGDDDEGGGGGGASKVVAKKTTSRQVAGRDYTHESTCLVCWDGGSITMCDRCPAVYHPEKVRTFE